MRWVVSEKVHDDENLVKAHLVARGFEENYTQDLRKDSPTCMKESLRLLATIGSSEKWNIMDIKSAFLQGKEIQRKICLKPPKEAAWEGKLWELKKTVYGLGDASRKWYLKVKEELVRAGAEVSKFDEALFFWKQDNCLHGILSTHVDDFLFYGSNNFEDAVINKIRKKFQISKEESETFKYLGLEIEQTEQCIMMHQTKYIEDIEFLEIPKGSRNEELLKAKEFGNLRSLLGQLALVSNQKRPDISFEVCQLSVNLKNPKVKDLVQVNKVGIWCSG